MRDGVKLATNVFLPPGDGPWPVVLTRTPYGKGKAAEREKQEAEYARRGYVRIVQDCRGKFASEGQYRAFIDDINDGYDTVEWAAAQPWSNGKIGMIGGSAMGITANHAAMSGAPHLVCNVVIVAHGSSYHNSGYPGGIFLKNMNEEWLRGQGVPPANVPRPIHRVYDDSFRDLDMQHYLAKIRTPTINIGGWYDIFSQGNIDCFVGLQNQGAEPARGNQKLIMGAFGHGKLAGDLKYPADAGRYDAGLGFRWFDHWLKGEDNGVEREPAVRYYLMGDTMDPSAPGNAWRTAETWPPPGEVTPYYLAAGGNLSPKPPAENASSSEAADTFTYDPKDPVPTVGGNNLMLPLGPMDQRTVSEPQRRAEVRNRTAGRGRRDSRPGCGRADRQHRCRGHRFHGQIDRRLPQRLRGAVIGSGFSSAISRRIQPHGAGREGQALFDQGKPLVDGTRLQQGAQDRDSCHEQQLAPIRAALQYLGTPGKL